MRGLLPGTRLRPSHRGMVWLLVVLGVAYILSLRSSPEPGRGMREQRVLALVGDPACDPVGGACRAIGHGRHVTARLSARVRPLQPFDVSVLPAGFAPRSIQRVDVEMVMPGMEMGLNRYRLEAADDRWVGQVTLPVCTSGRTDWVVVVSIDIGDTIYRARFPFTLP